MPTRMWGLDARAPSTHATEPPVLMANLQQEGTLNHLLSILAMSEAGQSHAKRPDTEPEGSRPGSVIRFLQFGSRKDI